jgi:hypothetical protein
LSEFSAQRRTSIKDGVALFAFIAGWFAAVPYGWPYISHGFDDGDNPGGAIGSAWERYHRGHRAPPGADSDVPDVTTARGGGHATRAQGSTGLELSPRFELSVEVGDYLCLMRLVSTEPLDVARTTTALAQTVNIAA